MILGLSSFQTNLKMVVHFDLGKGLTLCSSLINS